MNQNTINSGLQQLNSFVMNNVKTANNTIKNTLSNVTEPITQSIQSTMENTPSPMISIPVIIGLGVLIISFIIVVIFRQQITQGLELVWEKIRQFMGWAPSSPSPPFVPDNMFPQCVDKLLP